MMNRESGFGLFKLSKFTPCKSRIISQTNDAHEASQVTEYEISIEDFKDLEPIKYLEGPRPK